jgi:hypothetical protein
MTDVIFGEDQRPPEQDVSRPGAVCGPLAEAEADHVDWHQIAQLVQRACSPRLALRIVR